MAYTFNRLDPEEEASISPIVWIPAKTGRVRTANGYLKAVLHRDDGVQVEVCQLGLVNFPSRLA